MSEEWWRTLFGEDYAEIFDLAEGETVEQVDFVLSHLRIEPRHVVLDLCCGHGRHVRELARRGYRVVGLDMSPEQLRRAGRQPGDEEGQFDLIRGDARSLPLRAGSCDAVICMFTSFGYFSDRQNERVIGEIGRVLREGGQFLLDVPNPSAVWRQLRPQRWQEDIEGGRVLLEELRRDPVRGRIDSRKILYDRGKRREYRFSVREYSYPELRVMVESVGMRIAGLWGDFQGRPLTDKSDRMILKAETRGRTRKGASASKCRA